MTSSHASHLVDAALDGPAIVFGSLPPTGRDLDLVVRASELEDVSRRLENAGFSRFGASLVRFREGTAYEVEIVAFETWRLSTAAVEDLLAYALPVQGYTHLLRPSPHHSLLVFARRLAGGMTLDDRKGVRISALLAEDSAAWEKASMVASLWGVAAPLSALQNAWRGDPTASSAGLARGSIRRARRTRFRRRGAVVSLSGLDGSGKSTQAAHLRNALISLGFEAETEWTRLACDPVVRRVGPFVKRLVGYLPFKAVPPLVDDDDDPEGHLRSYPDGEPPPPDAGSLLRQRSRLVNYAWACVVAWANATSHRRTARKHRRAGTVLICDRFVLDSRVQLAFRYGATGLRLQKGLIRWLSPKPLRSFFLDVKATTARSRKPEQYTTRELEQLRALYLREVDSVGAMLVDGERSEMEIAALIAQTVWQTLKEGR